ncbi:MAG: hypothetical protein JNK58_12900 [Phycisphaerae bacterium]|nr:hypothetical protein [Phycisphaerae bacterium]
MTTSRARTAGDRIDELMEEASQALIAGRYADTERLALEALLQAHQALDYERMARVLLPLQESRRLRRQQASDVKKVTRLSSYADLEAYLTGNKTIQRGCYLIEPPLVGADGRELRERALSEDVPVFVIVREPETRLNQWPIVMVGPVTVRTRVSPPKKVDVAWMLQAGEALGDHALTQVDPADDAIARVEHLLEMLSTVADHEKLHQALIAACLEAHALVLATPKKRGRPRKEDQDDDFPEDDEPII